jgi:hypothetical protein
MGAVQSIAASAARLEKASISAIGLSMSSKAITHLGIRMCSVNGCRNVDASREGDGWKIVESRRYCPRCYAFIFLPPPPSKGCRHDDFPMDENGVGICGLCGAEENGSQM